MLSNFRLNSETVLTEKFFFKSLKSECVKKVLKLLIRFDAIRI